MQRYARIANSALHVDLTETDGSVVIALAVDTNELQPTDEAVDAALAIVLKMCRSMTDAHFSPRLVKFRHADNGHISHYIDYFACPVHFGAQITRWSSSSLRYSNP